MDRREFLRLAAASTVAVSGLFVYGCSSGGGKSDGSDTSDEIDLTDAHNVAIVYATRANSSAAISVDEGSALGIREAFEKAVAAEGFVAIVLADGNPQSVSTSVTLAEKQKVLRRNEINDAVTSVLSTDFTAQAEEADIFKAIVKANKELGKVPDDNELPNLLIVVDSGISTDGAINFTEQTTRNALLDPSLLVAKLREEGELVQFSNIDKVLWYGMGYVCEPQGEPTEGTRKAMMGLYRAVFEAAGVELLGNDEVFKECEEAERDADDLPAVTVVEMPRIPVDVDGNPVLVGDNISLDEKTSNLTFAVGSSEFTDAAKAQETLQVYIDQLLDFPALTAVIYGYTDTTGSTESNQALSERRAESVMRLFLDAGVKPEQLSTVGGGESTMFDTDEQNRRVEIVLA